jgi:DNA invertase Pin-like site-specific DNA recombinase
MKTKKELQNSPVKLLEPWRNINKGETRDPQKKLVSAKRFRVGGYVRLSPSGQEREEGSMVSHPQRITQFVESKNIQHGGEWGEIVEWYVDKDFSGKDMNRPGFQKMLRDIKSGHINAIVVTELSRLNRKVKDFLEVYELFKSCNTAFFCLRENFDTSTPMGELMLIQAMSFAQYERQTIVDRIKKGARARAERGLANGYVPLGFKLVEHRPNYREVDESEKAYIEMIFRKFLELKRINHLVKYLNENGSRSKEFITKAGKKAGGNRWTLSSIHNVLTNRCYIGEREINKKHRTLNSENLKEEELYCFVDAHWPALIPTDLFYDVQSLLESNKKKARKYVHEYRLTGLIECAECGAPMVGKSGTGKNSKYFYYGHKRKLVTSNDNHLKRCRIENISAPILEAALIGRLKDLSNDRELVTELAMSSSAQSKSRLEHMKSLIGAKEQERRRLQVKLDNLYDSIAETDDKALRVGLADKAKEIQAQVDQSEELLQNLKSDYSKSNNVVDVSEAMEFIRIFREKAFDKQPVAAQAEILKSRVKRLIVRDNGIIAVEIFGRKQETIMDLSGNGSYGINGKNYGINGNCGADIRSAIAAKGAEISEVFEEKGLKLKNPVEPITRRASVRTGFKMVAGAGFEPTTFGL